MKELMMKAPHMDHAWETFFRLPNPAADDQAPAGDPAYLQARGISPDAPALLRILREELHPLLRGLGPRLGWYCFLIHDGASGVPAPPEDKGLYLHLRFCPARVADKGDFKEILKRQAPEWVFTRKAALSQYIAGIEKDSMGGGVHKAWLLLGQQCEWVLSFLDSTSAMDDLMLVQHMRQFLHFFANMTQIRVA